MTYFPFPVSLRQVWQYTLPFMTLLQVTAVLWVSWNVCSKTNVKLSNLSQQVERTEKVQNCLSPKFAKKFVIDYYFEIVQKLKFGIYDIDNKTIDLSDDDFLGQLDCTLGQVRRFSLSFHNACSHKAVLKCLNLLNNESICKCLTQRCVESFSSLLSVLMNRVFTYLDAQFLNRYLHRIIQDTLLM